MAVLHSLNGWVSSGFRTLDSSWGTNWVYYYWFEKYEDKLIIHFELGGWNLTDELTKRTNALIEASKKKVDEYRYKRLYYKAVKLSQDDYEASLRNATKSLVKSALENEKKLLSLVKETAVDWSLQEEKLRCSYAYYKLVNELVNAQKEGKLKCQLKLFNKYKFVNCNIKYA